MSIDMKKKPGFNRPLGGDVIWQADGAEWSDKMLRDRAVSEVIRNPEASGLKINALDVYVKPGEGVCYYVAKHSHGEVTGSFAL